MKMRVFTLKLDATTGTFDDGALADFFTTNDALDATEHWFVHDGTPTLTMVIRYRDGASSSQPKAATADPTLRKKSRPRIWKLGAPVVATRQVDAEAARRPLCEVRAPRTSTMKGWMGSRHSTCRGAPSSPYLSAKLGRARGHPRSALQAS